MSTNGTEPATVEDRSTASRRTKRAAVVAVWAVTTAFLATVGWVAGANTGDAPVVLFGALPVPNDPLGLALVAVVVGNVAFVGVAAAVSVAVRRDRASVAGGEEP